MKNIILISGKMQSGKNQFADYLKAELLSKGKTIRTDLFAKDLKQGCLEDFTYMTKQINEHIEKIKSYINDEGLDSFDEVTKLLNDLTVTKEENWYEEKTLISRLLLQTYGTQIFRNRVDENHWVNQVLKRFFESGEDFTLVTDTRFENEVEWVKECCDKENQNETIVDINGLVNVITIRINREFKENALLLHDSETGLDDYLKWDYKVNNNETLEDLQAVARSLSNLIGE